MQVLTQLNKIIITGTGKGEVFSYFENEGCLVFYFLSMFFGNLHALALNTGVPKQLKQKGYLLVTSGKGEKALWF